MIYSFENLDVWQKSRNLVMSVYKITADFPLDEKYGLSSQLRRASISVSSNIAEGSTRWSKTDQARFYQIAFGSLMEVLNQLILASDLGFVDKERLTEIRVEIESIGRMLNSLHQSTDTPRPF
ncbi:MAG TPA: four helix bundle protein [Bacteroidales bacterium]|nr:four helix bundle protein [Bacteroidales bacterium]